MADRYDVVVAGHLCLDVVLQFSAVAAEAFFKPGQTTRVPPATLAIGGAVANTGLALHHLGMQVDLMAKVGDDMWGQATLDIIRRTDPRLTEGLHHVDAAAACTFVFNVEGGDHMFVGIPGPNETFGIDDIDYATLAQTRCFHFGYPPLLPRIYTNAGAEFAELMRQAKATGATVSLDMSMPDMTTSAVTADWEAILGAVLPHVDLCLPSIGEMLLLLDRPTYDRLCAAPGGLAHQITPQIVTDMADRLLGLGATVVGLKLGHLGFYLRSGPMAHFEGFGRAAVDPATWAERELWAPAFEARVVGTTGAGDATVAGFLASLLRGSDPATSLRIACGAGASNVETADAQGGLRSWSDLSARVERWPTHALALESDGWHFDPASQVWRGPRDQRR